MSCHDSEGWPRRCDLVMVGGENGIVSTGDAEGSKASRDYCVGRRAE